MLSERVQAIEELFQKVLAQPASRREKFLEAESENDTDLRDRVQSLLNAHERAGEFMVDPTVSGGTNNSTNVDELEPLEVSSTIGNYKILQKIGEGGYGLVFMVEQQEPVRRRVALKIIKLGMDTRQVLARFEAERQALAMMDHPNIATVFDAGHTDSGRPYFVMELVQGIPITEFCDNSQLDTQDRLRLFIEVCLAVQHAHQKGIIHRDLKPSNVLITLRDGVPVPKVIDFGIAKATQTQLTEKTLFTEFRQFVGTPAYVSPEQAAMSEQDVDTRTDVYSLGVMLYEVLTGTTPFDPSQLRKAGLGEMQRIIREVEPPKPSTRVSEMTVAQQTTLAQKSGIAPGSLTRELSGDLDWIILKALDKDRAQRYISAADLARDVGRFLVDEPIEARPPSLGYRMQKMVRRCRRHKVATALGGVALAAFLGGVAGVFWQWQRAESEATRATHLAQAELSHRERVESVASEMQMQRAEDLLKADYVHEGLAYLAGVARKDPGNLEVAERLVSALTFRSFALPALPSLRHGAAVSGVCWSPDGAFLVTASDDATVAVWDAKTGERQAELRHDTAVSFVRISADSKRILSATAEGARLWDAQTFQPLTPVINVDDGSLLVWTEMSPDGTRFVVTYDNNSAVVFDGFTGAPIDTARIEERSDIFMARFSADAAKLVTASQGTVRVWDAQTGEALTGRLLHKPLKCVDISPDGSRVIAGGYANRTRVWSVESGKELGFSMKHAGVVTSVRFSEDGRSAVSCARDGTAQPWMTSTGKKLCRPLRHRSEVADARFSSGGTRLLTFGRQNTFSVWNVKTGTRITEPVRLPRAVTSAEFNPAGDAVIVGCQDGAAYVFHVEPGAARPQQLGSGLWAIDFDASGQRFVTGARDGSVQIWDADRGVEITNGTLRLPDWVNNVALNPDGKRIAAGSRGGTVSVWDAESGELLFSKGGGRVSRLRFSPDGRSLVTSRFDGTVEILDAFTGQPMIPKKIRHSGRIWAAYHSPDGKLVATASTDQTSRVWDASTGHPVSDPLMHRDEVQWLDFSPDSRLLATGAMDHSARVWDARTGSLHFEAVHGGPVIRVVFAPGGQRLATASSDHTAVLWEVNSGKAIGEPLRHGKEVYGVEFSSDGTRIATCSNDGTIRIWDGLSGKPVSEPLMHRAGVSQIKFRDRRILSRTVRLEVALWELPEVLVPIPGWLPALAEGIAGKRLTSGGQLEDTSVDAILDIRDLNVSTESPEQAEWERWRAWFFANRIERTISPTSLISPKRGKFR